MIARADEHNEPISPMNSPMLGMIAARLTVAKIKSIIIFVRKIFCLSMRPLLYQTLKKGLKDRKEIRK